MSESRTIYTFGHGTAGEIELAALIRAAGLKMVVDVRSVPKSRAHPHVWADRMALWVPDLAAAAYQWCPALGGFRKPHADSPNVSLRHPSFRGYADYMQTPEFAAALAALVEEAEPRRTAIMCSETLWWRCHRRLVADALVLARGIDVAHLMHSGAPQPHRLTPGVRLMPQGYLQYDALEVP
jgi:uncharacterized protein (DUF488 family)